MQTDVNMLQVVYAITVEGYAELRNQASILSLKERTVLTLIDGVCPVAQYLPFLSTFEPVIEKMKKLEHKGYLRRAGHVAAHAVQKFDEEVSKDSQVSHWQSISADSASSGYAPLR